MDSAVSVEGISREQLVVLVLKLKDRQKELVSLCRKSEEEKEALRRSLKRVRDEASAKLAKAKTAIESLPALQAELQQLRNCRLHLAQEETERLRKVTASSDSKLEVLRALAERGPEELSELCSAVLRLQDAAASVSSPAAEEDDDVSAWLSTQAADHSENVPTCVAAAAASVAEWLERLVIQGLGTQVSSTQLEAVEACDAAKSAAAAELEARYAAESAAADAIQAKELIAIELANAKTACAELSQELQNQSAAMMKAKETEEQLECVRQQLGALKQKSDDSNTALDHQVSELRHQIAAKDKQSLEYHNALRKLGESVQYSDR